MRGLLGRTLRPAVEAALGRLERQLGPEAHVARARALLARTRGDAAWQAARADVERALAWGALSLPAPPLPEVGAPELLAIAADELGAPARALHLAALGLPEPAAARGSGGALADALSALPLDGAWRGGAPVSLHALGCVLGAALRVGAVDGVAARAALERALGGLEARRWFARAGSPYGAAAALRVALAVEGPSPDAPWRDVCERMLRHVEVRREEALRPRPEDGVDAERALLERLRFTHAFLDVTERRGDLRFLNAALKLNDRHYAEVGRARGAAADLIAFHYAASVARQELALRERVP